MSTPLTGPQARALAVLRDLNDAPGALSNPRAVAKALWPDSVGWQNRSRRLSTAAGGAMGATMPMKAATLLWRLYERGCAVPPMSDQYDWRVTDLGRRVLDGTDQPRPKRTERKPTDA